MAVGQENSRGEENLRPAEETWRPSVFIKVEISEDEMEEEKINEDSKDQANLVGFNDRRFGDGPLDNNQDMPDVEKICQVDQDISAEREENKKCIETLQPECDIKVEFEETEWEDKTSEKPKARCPTPPSPESSSQHDEELYSPVTSPFHPPNQDSSISEYKDEIFECLNVKVEASEDANYSDICEKRFTNADDMKTHISNEHSNNDSRIFCPECEFVAKNQNALRYHTNRKHNGDQLACDASDCSYVAGSKSALKEHKSRKHTGIRYPCDQCDYAGPTKVLLKIHQQNKHQGLRFVCDICETQFKSKAGLKYHRENAICQSDRKKPRECPRRHTCDECDYSTDRSLDLKRHIKFKHEGVKDFMCSSCDFRTSNQRYLDSHIESFHPDVADASSEPATSCPHPGCNFATRIKTRMTGHIKIRHSDTSFHCDKCAYVSHTAQNLKEHIKIKHEGRMFPCMHCPYVTGYRSTLDKHIRGVHLNIKSTCDQCGASFKDVRRLRLHMKKEHSEEQPEFHCDQCPKSFYEDNHLKAHQKTHLIKCECDQCGASFKDKRRLTYHMKKEHSGKPPEFNCDQCHKSFYEACHLKAHKNTHLTAAKIRTSGGVEYCMDDGCTFSTTISREMANHAKFFHLDGSCETACDRCERLFRNTRILHYHKRRIHMTATGRKNSYSCPLCFREFLQKSRLDKHLRNWHPNGSNKDGHFCDECSNFSRRAVIFESQESLDDHNRIVHSPEEITRLSCEDCLFKAINTGQLISHGAAKDCEDMTEFWCQICSSSIQSFKELKQHKVSLHNQFEATVDKKVYQLSPCDQCDFVAHYEQHLTSHTKTFHKEEMVLKTER